MQAQMAMGQLTSTPTQEYFAQERNKLLVILQKYDSLKYLLTENPSDVDIVILDLLVGKDFFTQSGEIYQTLKKDQEKDLAHLKSIEDQISQLQSSWIFGQRRANQLKNKLGNSIGELKSVISMRENTIKSVGKYFDNIYSVNEQLRFQLKNPQEGNLAILKFPKGTSIDNLTKQDFRK